MANVIGIDPTVDYAFKLLLGSPEHSHITIHFLNAILGDRPRITQVEFQNPFLGKEFDEDKLSILDILAVDEHGQRLNIEMQTSMPAGLVQRLSYYDARLYVDQMTEGRPYQDLRPAIVICVLSVALFPHRNQLHTDFRFRDQNGQVLTDDLQIHTLELTKLNATRKNLDAVSAIERWAYFLKFAQSMTMSDIKELLPEPAFTEAAGVLEMISQSPGQLHEYSARLKLRLDDAARIDYARQSGLEEGLLRGQLIGRITTLHEILSLKSPTEDELSKLDLAELTAYCETLKPQIPTR